MNCVIGVARSRSVDKETDEVLGVIQNDLFTLGADLASPVEVDVPRIDESFVTTLEGFADRFLAPNSFSREAPRPVRFCTSRGRLPDAPKGALWRCQKRSR